MQVPVPQAASIFIAISTSVYSNNYGEFAPLKFMNVPGSL